MDSGTVTTKQEAVMKVADSEVPIDGERQTGL
jgi:hypothetical protein